eukprot:5989662-Prorocentrum_lima.AAC.1
MSPRAHQLHQWPVHVEEWSPIWVLVHKHASRLKWGPMPICATSATTFPAVSVGSSRVASMAAITF